MMMVGMPRYRLPREVIDREVAMIEDLGVEFVFNTHFGTDVTMEQLKTEGFEAFLFAIGAHKAYQMKIQGEDEFHRNPDRLCGCASLSHRGLRKRMLFSHSSRDARGPW